MAKAIMVQGTMSNSGKTFVTAGLCRVLRENSFPTLDLRQNR